MEERLSSFAKAPGKWLAPRGFARVYLGFGFIPAFSRCFSGQPCCSRHGSGPRNRRTRLRFSHWDMKRTHDLVLSPPFRTMLIGHPSSVLSLVPEEAYVQPLCGSPSLCVQPCLPCGLMDHLKGMSPPPQSFWI